MNDRLPPIAVAFTGASGIQYGLRLVECLLQAGRTVYLMVSQAAQVVVNMETDLSLPGRPEEMQGTCQTCLPVRPGSCRCSGGNNGQPLWPAARIRPRPW